MTTNRYEPKEANLTNIGGDDDVVHDKHVDARHRCQISVAKAGKGLLAGLSNNENKN